MADSPFTHIDERAAPRMVDVGDKALTKRVARAQAVVRFPASVAAQLRERQFASAKGPVFHTAIIAGVMAAKRTSELIPFCHPLSIERCDIEIEMQGDDAVVSCTAALTGRTGVEMEALTGATVAALTIYDMCKALSREISIVHVGLIEKRGGKSDLP